MWSSVVRYGGENPQICFDAITTTALYNFSSYSTEL